MKKFSKFEKTAIMNAAKSSYVLVEKKEKLAEKLAEERAKMEKKFAEKTAKIQGEILANQDLLNKFEAPIMELTGGKHSYELVKKSVENVTKSDGSVSKSTRYTFIEEDSTDEPSAETSTVNESSNDTAVADSPEFNFEAESEPSEPAEENNSSENDEEIDPFAD